MTPNARVSMMMSCGFTLVLLPALWLFDYLGLAATGQLLLALLIPAWVIAMMLPVDYGEPGRGTPILGWTVLWAINVILYWGPFYWVLAMRDELSGKAARPN